METTQRLRERRQAQQMEIKEAAYRLGKSYQYIRQLEEGINSPPAWPLLGELAELYATSTDYLLGLTDDPAPAQGRDLPEFGAEMLALLRTAPPAVGEELLAVGRVLAEHEQRRQDDLAALTMLLDAIEALRGAEFTARVVDVLESARTAGVARPPDSALRARLAALLAGE